MSMRDLIEFAENPEVRSFVRGMIAESRPEMFQGVFVGHHPLWEWLQRRLKDDYHRFFPWELGLWPQEPAYEGEDFPDISWTDSHWGHFCEWKQKDPKPFIIIFRLKPLNETMRESRARLDQMLEKGRFFAISEERPIARLYAKNHFATKPDGAFGGASIETSMGMKGTLGGFLSDPKRNKLYAMTCSHVAAAGDHVSFLTQKGAKRPLGQCVLNSSIVPHALCGANCLEAPDAAMTDVALIEVPSASVATTEAISLGPVTDIVPRKRIPRSVQMVGAASGHHHLSAMKFGFWQEFKLHDGSCACFGNLFDLQAPGRQYYDPKLAVLVSRPVRGGDSGAWICSATMGGDFGLCGHMVGGDGIDGYATFAQTTMDWISEQNGFRDLVPC
jgi:hypothetical protein